MRVLQLEGGAMAASEGRGEHFRAVAAALAADGFAAVNFGVNGRYEDAAAIWQDAGSECGGQDEQHADV